MLSLKRHRNIVSTFGMCQEQANFSMVMEFLPNGSLLDLCQRTMEESGELLTDRTMWKVLRGVALGMSALASQGVVHRDLAARNILLDAELEPRVSDFGFSRNVGEQSQGKTASTVGPVKVRPSCGRCNPSHSVLQFFFFKSGWHLSRSEIASTRKSQTSGLLDA
jgi:serine/threonine protein kinase